MSNANKVCLPIALCKTEEKLSHRCCQLWTTLYFMGKRMNSRKTKTVKESTWRKAKRSQNLNIFLQNPQIVITGLPKWTIFNMCKIPYSLKIALKVLLATIFHKCY